MFISKIKFWNKLCYEKIILRCWYSNIFWYLLHQSNSNFSAVKNLVGGRTYYFRVLANSLKSYESSEEVKFPVPARVKHKAITAGVVGGILFFIVAIILSVCAVKICNKRKRRKQEKGETLKIEKHNFHKKMFFSCFRKPAYNMVACRISDSRNGGSATDSQVPLKK